MLRPVPEPPEDGRGDCPLGVCEGNGWVLQEDGTATPCECRERRIGKALSRGMGTGIPKRFRGVSFDRKPIRDLDPFILRPVRAFVEGIEGNVDAGRGLWFTGDLGTGKTSLAMLVSREAEKVGKSVAVYPVTRLLAEIKDTYDSDSTGSYMQLFRRLCSVDLLHLDDLAAAAPNDWVQQTFYTVINDRYQENRSIVFTADVQNPLDLRRYLGNRVFSRLMEMCGEPIQMFGEDHRLRSMG